MWFVPPINNLSYDTFTARVVFIFLYEQQWVPGWYLCEWSGPVWLLGYIVSFTALIFVLNDFVSGVMYRDREWVLNDCSFPLSIQMVCTPNVHRWCRTVKFNLSICLTKGISLYDVPHPPTLVAYDFAVFVVFGCWFDFISRFALAMLWSSHLPFTIFIFFVVTWLLLSNSLCLVWWKGKWKDEER